MLGNVIRVKSNLTSRYYRTKREGYIIRNEQHRKSSLSLIALMLCTFAIGTTEFITMGILPEVSQDLHVSISAAGLLVTGYAIGVAIGAPLLTALTGRMERKQLLIGLMMLFVAGNVLCAIAPNYSILLIARFAVAFAHGTFFGAGAVVASKLVPAEKQASAVAMDLHRRVCRKYYWCTAWDMGWPADGLACLILVCQCAWIAGHAGCSDMDPKHTNRSEQPIAPGTPRIEEFTSTADVSYDHTEFRWYFRCIHFHCTDINRDNGVFFRANHADLALVRSRINDGEYNCRKACQSKHHADGNRGTHIICPCDGPVVLHDARQVGSRSYDSVVGASLVRSRSGIANAHYRQSQRGT